MNREGYLQTNMTIMLITDCPTITVHMGKCYKALIDSGAAIPLVRYSTYENTEDSLKTAIHIALILLNTVDGSPMTALGIMTLQLRMADFKFSHNFIVCDRLPEMELLFGIIVQKKFSLSYTWDREKIATYKRRVDSLPTPETVNRRHMLLLSNQPLRYNPCTMASYLSRSKDL